MATAASTRPPQARIWDEYATFFDYYQTVEVSASFYPYKWETTSSTAGVALVNARPTYSIIDPETNVPSTVSFMASYGNMHVTPAYATHHRKMHYTLLGMEKQPKVILETRGSSAARILYDDPATIVGFVQAPNFLTNSPAGMLIFSVTYVFSG